MCHAFANISHDGNDSLAFFIIIIHPVGMINKKIAFITTMPRKNSELETQKTLYTAKNVISNFRLLITSKFHENKQKSTNFH